MVLKKGFWHHYANIWTFLFFTFSHTRRCKGKVFYFLRPQKIAFGVCYPFFVVRCASDIWSCSKFWQIFRLIFYFLYWIFYQCRFCCFGNFSDLLELQFRWIIMSIVLSLLNFTKMLKKRYVARVSAEFQLRKGQKFRNNSFSIFPLYFMIDSDFLLLFSFVLIPQQMFGMKSAENKHRFSVIDMNFERPLVRKILNYKCNPSSFVWIRNDEWFLNSQLNERKKERGIEHPLCIYNILIKIDVDRFHLANLRPMGWDLVKIYFHRLKKKG